MLESEPKLPRVDDREFLELTLMFLGHHSKKYNSEVIKFNVPGAVRHAKWMAKAI